MPNTQKLYREILSKAWAFSWSNKKLWIFGFFATFLQTSGIIETIVRVFNRLPQSQWTLTTLVEGAYPGAPIISGLITAPKNSAAFVQVVVILAIILGLLALLLWFVGAMEGGLVWSAFKKKSVSVSETFIQGRFFAWPIVGIHVLAKLLFAVCFLIISLPLLLVTQHNIIQNVILSVLALLIFFPLLLVISFTAIYAVCAIIIKKQKISQAIETAWRILKSYWVISIETAVILFGISLAGGLAVVLFMVILSIPATLLIIASLVAGTSVIYTFVMAIMLFVGVALVLITGSFITTFQLVTWVFMFERLSKQGAISKLARILYAVPRLFLKKT